MRIILWMLLPLLVLAQSHSLKTFINSASKTNGLIKAKEINVRSKQQEIEAAKSAYWPTVDMGADYSLKTPNYVVSPGQNGNIYAAVSVDLYDGGRKDAILRSRGFEHEASLFEKAAFEKSITLEIVRHYYGIQTLKATLHALQKRAEELKAQIVRVIQVGPLDRPVADGDDDASAFLFRHDQAGAASAQEGADRVDGEVADQVVGAHVL